MFVFQSASLMIIGMLLGTKRRYFDVCHVCLSRRTVAQVLNEDNVNEVLECRSPYQLEDFTVI